MQNDEGGWEEDTSAWLVADAAPEVAKLVSSMPEYHEPLMHILVGTEDTNSECLEIAQDLGTGVVCDATCSSGAYVWPGTPVALELLSLVCSGRAPEAWPTDVVDAQFTTAVELAAGVGAGAAGMARLWPSCHILATDGSARWLTLLEENAARNGVGDRVESAVLAFGDVHAAAELLRRPLLKGRAPDVLFCVDATYDGGECYEHLCTSLCALAGPRTVTVLGHKKRRACEASFFALLAAHFTFRLAIEDVDTGNCIYVVRQRSADAKATGPASLLFRDDSDDRVFSVPLARFSEFAYDPALHTVMGAVDAAGGRSSG
eukprot:gnl/TRDRNA2_/TRDRNA2_160564_c0_seq4.p1 gnl/TRDRNA2_/TRDRNA2_160564_c0~~gnl/TRDRNA2_/TRDRNA2_160564_c0_seq4.p1  ORF type:complete len:318 (+),score=55.01 gnl/TRDRNA2_/TRDRNA2_160564_c0_seq4:108-1061(+)